MLLHGLHSEELCVQFPEATGFGVERHQVIASAQEYIVQRSGDPLWLKPAVAAFGCRETEMPGHALDARMPPGDLDTVAKPSQHDVRKQPAFTCGANRVPLPPRLPRPLPVRRQLEALLDSPRRKSSGLQRRPCSVLVVSRWKPFLVKQWIPVVCKPLHQGKQVPVDRIGPLTILLVGAQIPTLDPQLEATPGEAGVRLHRLAIIGVWSERQPQCEFTGVPGKPLPSSAHLLARSIPVRSDVAPTYALLIEPPAPKPLRHSNPPDWVAVPDVWSMLPRAVRLSLAHSVPRVVTQLTLGQHLLCTRCVDPLRTERATASPLPRILVLQAAFVTHRANVAVIAPSFAGVQPSVPQLEQERPGRPVDDHVPVRTTTGGPEEDVLVSVGRFVRGPVLVDRLPDDHPLVLEPLSSAEPNPP